MHYSRGPNKGKIHSSYLQKKVNKYLDQTLYRHQNYQSLQDSNLHTTQHLRDQKSKCIAEIHSLVRRSKQITDEEFHKRVKSIFKLDKKSYSSNTIWLATNILQVRQISFCSAIEYMRLIYEFLVEVSPQNWLAKSTLRIWHQDVSELHFNRQIRQAKNAPIFGVMVDESTQGQIKNLVIYY
ncbi:14371_t:CDS:2 [Funneliformis geosporum]|uniref:14371_t:CDS:1 n=1 Tax=Funneliformis geosporum TaxID=1117311 RepID=A0A9W4SK55_9GLOM|nr:14371_t:CDS:2 [Funneliformis geosporum]